MAGPDLTVVPVPITPGMREDVHRHAGAPAGTLRYAQNVRWGSQGAAERRPGTDEITATVSGSAFDLDTGLPIEISAVAAGATLVGTDGAAFALDPVAGGWHDAGLYSSAEPRPGRVDLFRAQVSQLVASTSDTAAISSDGYRFFGYTTDEFSADVRCHYTIQESNGVCTHAETLLDARIVKAVSVGTTIYVCVQRYATNAVDIYRTTFGGALDLVTSAFVTLDASTDAWDAAAWSSTAWVFAALDSSSTTITLHRMSAGASADDVSQSTSVVAGSKLSVYAEGNYAWLGWSDNTTGQFAKVSCYHWDGSALSSSFTNATVYSWTGTTQIGMPPLLGPGPDSSHVRMVGAIQNQSGHATPDVYTWKTALIETSGTLTKSTDQFGGFPASRPFGPRGQYVWARLNSRRTSSAAATETPSVIALLRCRDFDDSASVYWVVDLVGHKQSEYNNVEIPGFTDVGWWYTPPQTVEGTYFFGVPILLVGENGANSSIVAPSRYYSYREFAVNSALEHRSAALSAGTVTVAGQPCAIIPAAVSSHRDGSPMFIDGTELGFHSAPAIHGASWSNGSGALTNSGLYAYAAVYRYIDAAGRVHRSAPSAPTAIQLGATDDTVTVYVSCLNFQRFALATQCAVELYRTEDGGSTFFLVSDVDANDTAVAETAITDLTSDANLVRGRILYTQAQQIQNDMAPACRWLRSSETRLWAAGGWDPTIIQASKIIVPQEPPLWSDLDTFKVRLPEPCTGLAFQDGALLAFAATNIYAVNTDGGPGNDGLDTFADPRLVCPGIGCEDARSIVETPLGVVFKSRRGFELLPRGLGSVQPLPGVETQLETYGDIISATLHVDDRATTVQFVAREHADGNDGDTIVLVLDLDRQAWSVDVYPIDIAQIGLTADGRLLLASDDVGTSPAFLIEGPTALDDAGTFFRSRLTFHDIYPFGLYKEGYVDSVFARATADGTCTANVDISVAKGTTGGAAPTPRQTSWTFTGATTFETYRQRTPAQDQCAGTSIQIDAYDTQSGDAAGGVNWYGFGLAVRDRDSEIKLGESERG